MESANVRESIFLESGNIGRRAEFHIQREQIMSKGQEDTGASWQFISSLSVPNVAGDFVTARLRNVDNQMTSCPHLVVWPLRLTRSTAETKSQAKESGT
jgi:hypothetical protein